MPNVLDPNFRSLQDMFAKGLMANTDGYEPYAALLAKREQCVNKQSYKSSTNSREKALGKTSENLRATKDQLVCCRRNTVPAFPMKGTAGWIKATNPCPKELRGPDSLMPTLCMNFWNIQTALPVLTPYTILYSVMSKKSNSRSKHLYNLKGS